MANRRNSALHNKHVGTCFLSNPTEFGRSLRNRTDRRNRIAVFDLPNSSGNQIFLTGS
jgi:hypothetical protein